MKKIFDEIYGEIYETSDGYNFFTAKEALDHKLFNEFINWFNSTNTTLALNDNLDVADIYDWLYTNKHKLSIFIKHVIHNETTD